MISHFLFVAGVVSLGIFLFRMFLNKAPSLSATVSPIASIVPIATVPKIPSPSDAFEALQIINKRLAAVGRTPEEIQVLTRPLVDNILLNVK